MISEKPYLFRQHKQNSKMPRFVLVRQISKRTVKRLTWQPCLVCYVQHSLVYPATRLCHIKAQKLSNFQPLQAWA